jgi:phosphate transport system substrate-binding protein
MASLQNQVGDFVAPNSESFKTALESFKAELDPSNVADPRGAGSYPILTLSWLITRKDQDPEKAQALKDVVRYCLSDGQEVAGLLGYIPLTKPAVEQILQRLDSIKQASKRKILFTDSSP